MRGGEEGDQRSDEESQPLMKNVTSGSAGPLCIVIIHDGNLQNVHKTKRIYSNFYNHVDELPIAIPLIA